MSEGGGPPIPKMTNIIIFAVLLSIALPTIVASIKELLVPAIVLMILTMITMGLWKKIKHW